MKNDVELVLPSDLKAALFDHLFPGDGDEHGAVIAAGVHQIGDTTRLLGRDLFVALDGTDYVEGRYGYRMLRAEFIQPKLQYCRENRLAYLAIHNHGGHDSVALSRDDLDSHERGYPALVDLIEGPPVGGIVFARNAVAGDIWFSDKTRAKLSLVKVMGGNLLRLYPNRPKGRSKSLENYARQVLMFGSEGQKFLSDATVGVIGLGGVGSILVELLARLGVGRLIVTDPDRVEHSNLSRIIGADENDARDGSLKVDVAKRVAMRANRSCVVETLVGTFERSSIAREFLSCDFLFLAADSMAARLVFNAIVHQYFIPGIQVGSKIVQSRTSNQLEQVFSVARWISPGHGCLWCSGMIDRTKLAEDAKSMRERVEQAYGSEAPNPSVITLNAVAASQAVDDFLFFFLGLFDDGVHPLWRRNNHRMRTSHLEETSPHPTCTECGKASGTRYGKGEALDLPTTSH